MEIIGRISKGSKMDQIYISKSRIGFVNGDYVQILPIKSKPLEEPFKPYLYNVLNLEPLKLKIIEEIFNIINKNSEFDNIIVTGSFLEKGFNFNDIDILLISEKKINIQSLKNQIEIFTGINSHLILIENKQLIKGISLDPLYGMMLSKCISKKRFIFKVKREINYKTLDLSLLKSKTLIDNFDILNGNEKYYLTLNMISILSFIQGKKLNRKIVDKEIEKIFNIKINEIKNNLVKKKDFINKYKGIYNQTFSLIMESIKNEK